MNGSKSEKRGGKEEKQQDKASQRAHATRKTHQSDRAEAVKYLRDAADVLKGGGEARREEKERRAQHMSSEKNKSK